MLLASCRNPLLFCASHPLFSSCWQSIDFHGFLNALTFCWVKSKCNSCTFLSAFFCFSVEQKLQIKSLGCSCKTQNVWLAFFLNLKKKKLQKASTKQAINFKQKIWAMPRSLTLRTRFLIDRTLLTGHRYSLTTRISRNNILREYFKLLYH